MTKIFYNRTTGDGAVFDDAAVVTDWPDFQETQPDMTPMLAISARTQRDDLLAASDSMALADRITSDWTTYRAALRDIPAQEGFPASIVWPSQP